MLIFLHSDGRQEVIGRWLFDLGPFHIVKDGWKFRLLRQSKWTIKF